MGMSKGLKTSLLTQAQAQLFFTKAIAAPTVLITGSSTTGTNQPEYDREYEVRKTAKQHTNKKYFYVISVSDTDDVFYQVYHGGKIAFWVYKLVGSGPKYWKSPIPQGISCAPPTEPIGSSWKGIRKRTHLPATVGAIYLAIDKDIEAHVELLGHDEYVAGLLETEPENLKMIEGLEKLAEGEPEPDSDTQASAAFTTFISNAAGGLNSFYMSSGAMDPMAVEVEGDMNVGGILKVDGITIEDKMTHYIAEAVRDQTDEFMTDMLDAKKKVAGKASQ